MRTESELVCSSMLHCTTLRVVTASLRLAMLHIWTRQCKLHQSAANQQLHPAWPSASTDARPIHLHGPSTELASFPAATALVWVRHCTSIMQECAGVTSCMSNGPASASPARTCTVLHFKTKTSSHGLAALRGPLSGLLLECPQIRLTIPALRACDFMLRTVAKCLQQGKHRDLPRFDHR